MLAEASLLAQFRPGVTTPVLVYQAQIQTELTRLNVCNTTNQNHTFSIYHDDKGTAFGDDTLIFHDQAISGNETITVVSASAGAGISIQAGGAIAIESSTAGALNFSIYGVTARVTGGTTITS